MLLLDGSKRSLLYLFNSWPHEDSHVDMTSLTFLLTQGGKEIKGVGMNGEEINGFE